MTQETTRRVERHTVAWVFLGATLWTGACLGWFLRAALHG